MPATSSHTRDRATGGGAGDGAGDGADITQPRLGPIGWLRWAWRQLTSMRTALLLLLLLALAAIPGSVFPQRDIDPVKTRDYLEQHKTLGPFMDRVGLFDVYASPWFAAIYLLLFISLVGCVVPRLRILWRELRAAPPRAPRVLDRMPEHRVVELGDVEPERALEAAREVLRSRRYRVRAADAAATGGAGRSAYGSVSGERGYLREVGNLMFHVALLVVIVGVALGHLLGWRVDAIVPEGETFANTTSQHDTFTKGPWVDEESLPPFTVRVDQVRVAFETTLKGKQFGQPRSFEADVTTRDAPGAAERRRKLEVNEPLSFGQSSVYLLGNGYAPVITVKDAQGRQVYKQATVFRPQDNNYTSTGAVKVSALPPGKQLGFLGLFAPTISDEALRAMPQSDFPAPVAPGLLLELWEGDLFPGGRPQSVYTLDTQAMKQPTLESGLPVRLALRPGETQTLPGGRGTVTFEGVQRFAGLSVRYDPGKPVALLGAVLVLVGLVLSLVVRRRRAFVRIGERDGRTLLEVAGLAKNDDPRLGEAVDDLTEQLCERLGLTPPARSTKENAR
ncbi:cytochrome c biogenesis protein ResB [Arsenicicoccus bolidensis]|uniref:Cytochrome c biogenesis protein ResB n=1 Tax=Arsenicicoccus bolidensis TaxID=229480 RepID=A0ABS9Q2T7_9MICO|nr:cytochrome c biogenesis protein ResB [Arsenicicoccus bolidensis]MCG7321403.1 cytochrome c biogenesis protein ResB [Arsenicicoccus bolidensis]